MNIHEAARIEATRIVDRLRASRQQLETSLLVDVLCEAFAAGVVYGVVRAQHAVAITHATAQSQAAEAARP